MIDPTREQRETLTTGVTPPPTAITDEGALPVPSQPPMAVREPLFPRKVLIGWALVALTVWFAFTFIVPVVVESVKAAILSSLEPPASNTAAPTPPAPVAQPAQPAPSAIPASPAPAPRR